MRPRQFRNSLHRLGRNLKHNRLFAVYAGRFFVASKRLSEEIARELQKSLSASSPPPLIVYRALFSRRTSAGLNDRRAIFHSHLGRFGNAVSEIIGSLKLAEIASVGHVILDGHSVFAKSGDIPSDGHYLLPSGLQVWIDSPVSPTTVDLLVHTKGSGRMLGGIDCASTWREGGLLFNLNNPIPEDENTLTVHLRGGDVFGQRDVAHYGQPPFSFYQKLLELKKWQKVQLVSQDELNPVLTLIANYCANNGINFDWRQQSLRRDIETLLAARSLVASRGTFIPAVVGLSNNVKEVYFFEDKFVMQPPMSGLTLWRIYDSEGLFRKQLLSGNWINSISQRALMKDYPQENLAIEKIT